MKIQRNAHPSRGNGSGKEMRRFPDDSANLFEGKFHVRLSLLDAVLRTLGNDIVKNRVQWRATADEDGHYCFAVAL
jgi:hypothetical protein